MDIATLTNAPREVVIMGETFLVSALKLKDWGALAAWLLDHAPSPVSRLRSADLAGLSDADRQFVLREAFLATKSWPPQAGTLEWLDVLVKTPGGDAKFVETILGRHQAITPERAEELAGRMEGREFVTLWNRASGRDAPDPKGGATPDLTATPTASSLPGATNGAASSTGSAS